jgi:hypothetical protein
MPTSASTTKTGRRTRAALPRMRSLDYAAGIGAGGAVAAALLSQYRLSAP